MAEHQNQNEHHKPALIEEDAKQPPKPKMDPRRRKMIIWIVVAVVIIVGIGGGAYFYASSKTIYIDLSQIQAPLINLSPNDAGTLQQVFVQVGDTVTTGEPVARVGNEIVTAQTNGIIVSVDQNIGEYENTLTGQATVATMIDPTQLRVVGNLDENKGLADVQVGDPATFTVDAFGGEQFKGVVDEVSPTSEQSDVVFNISDQRPTNQFAVYVRFDSTQYPQLKNGMSARIWVYKQ
ncbi:MAG TPA: HlyD family efflux transporter periplasmic adaptor subunit [Candidatus Paceibacterota bacterium]|jgi:multidrug resistance efflux pump|nr:HlyD family efflux transporter periplasmic adaptor subunit [Candidatus Paceibacterota bacterium]